MFFQSQNVKIIKNKGHHEKADEKIRRQRICEVCSIGIGISFDAASTRSKGEV